MERSPSPPAATSERPAPGVRRRRLPLAFLVVVLLVAGALALARHATDSVGRYRDSVESWLGETLGRPVSIGTIEAEWRGLSPRLRVTDVRLLGRPGGGRPAAPLVRFAYATVTLDPWASLRARALRPGAIEVSGASLEVTPRPGGGVAVRGLGESAGANAGELAGAVGWLLSQGRVRLRDTEIVWSDPRGRSRPLTLSGVSLDVERGAGRGHRIRARGRLAGAGAGEIDVAVDLDGEPGRDDWTAEAFLRGTGLDLSALATILEPAGVAPLAGRVDLRLHTGWRAGAVERARGEVTIAGLRRAEPGAGAPPPAEVRGTVLARHAGADWTVRLGGVAIRVGEDAFPTHDVTLRLGAAGAGGEPGELRARLERASLSLAPWLAALAGAPPSIRSALRTLAPRGAVRDLAVDLVPSPGGGGWTVRAAGRLDGVATRAMGRLPAVDGLSGRVSFEPRRGLRIDLERAVLRSPGGDWFAEPLTVRASGGSLGWRASGRVWTASAREVRLAEGETEVRLQSATLTGAEDGARPRLGLLATVEHADVARAGRYLPRAVMRPKVVAWLDRALVAGRVRDATVRMDGPLDRLLASDDTFEARFTVEDGILDYAPGWPRISGITAEARFHGRQADFRIRAGRIYASRIDEARIAIDDLGRRHPLVTVSGRVRGPVQDGARYLRESPLHRRFRHLLDNVGAQGPSELRLEIGIPLRKDAPREVAGTLVTREARVDLPGLGEGLQGVAGRFRFDGSGVRASGVRATYLGRPIALEMTPVRGGSATRIDMAGTASADYLASHLHNAGLLSGAPARDAPLLGRMLGATSWRGRVEVPNASGGEGPVARLWIESDLEGVSLALPDPLAKPEQVRLPLRVQTRFEADGRRTIRAELGTIVGGLFSVRVRDGRPLLERGTVRFSDSVALELPRREGIAIRGNIERLPFGEWYALLESAVAARGASATHAPARGGPTLAPVRSVNVTVADLVLFGLPLAALRVDAERTGSGAWKATLLGPAAHGEVTVPVDVAGEGVTAAFERLALPLPRGTPAAPAPRPDPRELPPLRLSCRECSVGGRELGVVKLSASPIEDGLRIDSLYVLNSAYEARAAGTWTRAGSGDRSRFQVEVHSDDLGRFVDAFGYGAGSASGGATDMLIEAGWPGSPADFDLAGLSGVLHFRAGQGRLPEVQPGATGRLFGLLMLPLLPRRLTLDFSDLFTNGLEFDRMEGSFAIEDGQAYTNNLLIDSATVRIDVAGRTGLVDETYDQRITVTPKVSSSLPLAALWLAEKLLNKRVLDDAFAYRYTVTGTWDDPRIERIEVPLPPRTEEPGSR